VSDKTTVQSAHSRVQKLGQPLLLCLREWWIMVRVNFTVKGCHSLSSAMLHASRRSRSEAQSAAQSKPLISIILLVVSLMDVGPTICFTICLPTPPAARHTLIFSARRYRMICDTLHGMFISHDVFGCLFATICFICLFISPDLDGHRAPECFTNVCSLVRT
jgi:hypothetical protein